jgi:hypothetical protein
MRVTKIDLTNPPGNLLKAIEIAEQGIKASAKGMLSKTQMQEAVELSSFLPTIPRPRIIAYLDADQKEIPAPARYDILTARQKAVMSACGDKLFLGHTNTEFELPSGPKQSKCATIASLWMPNATFHAHGNDEGDINKGWTFEDYEVVGGGNGFYIMGNEIFYVETDKDPESAATGWQIPPGRLHGVFSEDLENPALAVLRFQMQGLALRSELKDTKGWGVTRDEKVFTYASSAAQSMIEIANGRTPDPNDNLPASFVQSVRDAYQ